MDSGEEIQGLDEGWTFLGAKATEWIAGVVSMLIASNIYFHPAPRYMPHLIIILVVTTGFLAKARRSFPDEERGLANWLAARLGVPPPLIPAPASIQPIWSGAPIRELNKKTYFVELGLERVIEKPEERED